MSNRNYVIILIALTHLAHVVAMQQPSAPQYAYPMLIPSATSDSPAPSYAPYPNLESHQSAYTHSQQTSQYPQQPAQNEPAASFPPTPPSITDLKESDYTSLSKKIIFRTTLASAAVGFFSGAYFTHRATRCRDASLMAGTTCGVVGGCFGAMLSWFYTPENKYNYGVHKLRNINKDQLVQAAGNDSQNAGGLLVGAVNQAYINLAWPLYAGHMHLETKCDELEDTKAIFESAKNTSESWPYSNDSEIQTVRNSSILGAVICQEMWDNCSNAIQAIKDQPQFLHQAGLHQGHVTQQQNHEYQQQRLQLEQKKVLLAQQAAAAARRK